MPGNEPIWLGMSSSQLTNSYIFLRGVGIPPSISYHIFVLFTILVTLSHIETYRNHMYIYIYVFCFILGQTKIASFWWTELLCLARMECAVGIFAEKIYVGLTDLKQMQYI